MERIIGHSMIQSLSYQRLSQLESDIHSIQEDVGGFTIGEITAACFL